MNKPISLPGPVLASCEVELAVDWLVDLVEEVDGVVVVVLAELDTVAVWGFGLTDALDCFDDLAVDRPGAEALPVLKDKAMAVISAATQAI